MTRVALLNDSFISKVLERTLARLEIPTCVPIPLNPRIPRLSAQAASRLLGGKAPLLLYTNAEDCLPLVMESASHQLTRPIRALKDKVRMRRLLQGIEPDIYFREVPKEALKTFSPPPGKRLVLKPALGFLSLGVRRITNDWEQKVEEAQRELRDAEGMFPDFVLSGDRFLVEEYIEGEEYACDGYFDQAGEPVILSISHHLFEGEEDMRDLVYVSDAAMLRTLAPRVEAMLRALASRLGICRFPFHLEFRLRQDRLQVVELNPMRFGGFGLADLGAFAFGIDSYACFFEQKKPDVSGMLPDDGSCYAFVLGRVPPGARGRAPDHEAFRGTFGHILDYRPLDHRRYPCFCRVLAKGEAPEDFRKYLTMDFSRYFGKTG